MESFIEMHLKSQGSALADKFSIHKRTCHFCEVRLGTYLHCKDFSAIPVFIELNLVQVIKLHRSIVGFAEY